MSMVLSSAEASVVGQGIEDVAHSHVMRHSQTSFYNKIEIDR